MPGRRPPAPNPAGAHFLHDRRLIAQLVRVSGAGPGSLVLDLGAGLGAITTALAATGARVIAVERDPRLSARLGRRVSGYPRVSVVEADIREVPLPRRDFLVVANIPFSVTTELLRRLMAPPGRPLAGAELITAWGVARWLTATVPRDAETTWWTARYQVRIVSRVGAASFAPPPRADAAHVSIRPRALARSPAGQHRLRSLVRAAYRQPGMPVHRLPAMVSRRAVARAGLSPDAPAASLSGEQWHRLAMIATGTPVLRPDLPR